eukprot:3290231-Heterocapsa_arctica.AAC.1
MEEEHIRAGIISREHRAGNQDADKLATKGVEMHKVSEKQVEEVVKQDELVQGLITMLLDIMNNVNENALVRKKEDKRETKEAAGAFHGPRTG